MSEFVSVAVVQAGSFLFDTARSMELFESKTREAANQGAKLIVFPEAFLGGYPKGNHFGAPVGSRCPAGRDWFQKYHQSAIDVPGPETARIAELCGELNVDVVVGVVERDSTTPNGGTLFCSALVFSGDGKLIGKRRKLIPTAAERVIWGRGDGSTLDVFQTSAGRVGSVICWENFMPAMRMSQYAQGVEFYCAPTVDDRENWLSLMRTIAMEGRCFVLSANAFMTRAHVPAEFETVQGTASDTVLINGGSAIISPLGDVIAGPHFGGETILYAELDKREIVRGKMDFDIVGHYARPDVFTIQIDTEAKQGIDFGKS